jgi:AcrR family transcriptional regulator/predicted GNAT family acetyltransferase
MSVAAPTGQTAEEPRAPYSSPVRTDQARATRHAIVAAAAELFVQQGYAATTIDAVADRAGVGRKTVFSSVGSKGTLLKLAWDWALAGDDEPVPMTERPAVQAMLVERDPRRLVRMWADMLQDLGSRALPIGSVLLAAADVDAEVRALRDAIHRETLAGATAFVTHLAETGGLRPGMSVERAADACWALVNSLLQHLLVTERGWSHPEYREWFVRVASTTLLEPSDFPVAPPAVSVTDMPGKSRYEATVDGRVVGRLSYETARRVIVLLDTDADDAHEGVAGALVRRALDDVRADGTRQVVAVCPFAAWWLGRHPEYASLVHAPAAGRS